MRRTEQRPENRNANEQSDRQDENRWRKLGELEYQKSDGGQLDVPVSVHLHELRQNVMPEKHQDQKQSTKHGERIRNRSPQCRAQARDQIQMPAQIEQDRRQISRANARVDERSIKRRK